VRGELKLRLFNPASTVLDGAAEVFLLGGSAGSEIHAVRVAGARRHGRSCLIRLGVADTPEAARQWVGRQVAVREADLGRTAGAEFYCYQLIGLAVVDESGRHLGHVRDVLETGASDVLAIESGEREHLVPMIDEFVKRIDVEAGCVVIRPIEGLLD